MPQMKMVIEGLAQAGLGDKVKVMVVITGVKSKHILGPKEISINKNMEVDFIR